MKFRKISKKEMSEREKRVEKYPKKLKNIFLYIEDFQNIAEWLLFAVDVAYFGKNKMLAEVMTFYAVKQKRLFDSVVELTKFGFDEEALPLLRTMYETNLQIMNILLREDKEEYSQLLVFSQLPELMEYIEKSKHPEKEEIKNMAKKIWGNNWKSKFKDLGVDRLDVLSIAQFIDKKMKTKHYTDMYYLFYKYSSAYVHSDRIHIGVLNNKKGRLFDKCLKPCYEDAWNNIRFAGDMLIETLTNFVGSSNRPSYEPVQYMIVALSLALGLNKKEKKHEKEVLLPPNQELPFNARCGCGSNKEYRHCCMNKKYKYYVEGDGKTIKKTVPLHKEIKGLLRKSAYDFKNKFGREPNPDENPFWELVEHMNTFKDQDVYMVAYAKELLKAGMRKHLVYATLKTYGMLLTEENRGLFKDSDIEEYERYAREYLKKSKKVPELLEKEFIKFEKRSKIGKGKPWPKDKTNVSKKPETSSIKNSH